MENGRFSGHYQGNNNRGYQNSYDNNRRDDYHQRPNFDRPPNRDYNNRREGGGFMSRDRGDNNRFVSDYRVSIECTNQIHRFCLKSPIKSHLICN